MRYLKHSASLSLTINGFLDHNLHVYSDSDWAGDPLEKTSTSGYVVYFGHTPISWSSKKHRTVARSSTEVEYRAVAAAVAKTNWVMNLLRELRVSLPAPPTVYCDNVGTTYLCRNPVFHSRMKHIDIDFHFVREQVQQKLIDIQHIHSADQVADTLTKPLPRSSFKFHLDKLGLVLQTPNLREANNNTRV